jgi:hypothetical protein
MTRVRIPAVRLLSLLALAAVFTSACGDSSSSTEPEGLTIADLVGSWGASSALFTNQANPSQKFDIIAAGGTLNITVLNSGGVRTWLEIGDVSDEWDAMLTLNGNQLTATPAEASRPTRHWTIEKNSNGFTLTSTDASFDFTLSGATEVSASEVVVFVRR